MNKKFLSVILFSALMVGTEMCIRDSINSTLYTGQRLFLANQLGNVEHVRAFTLAHH